MKRRLLLLYIMELLLQNGPWGWKVLSFLFACSYYCFPMPRILIDIKKYIHIGKRFNCSSYQFLRIRFDNIVLDDKMMKKIGMEMKTYGKSLHTKLLYSTIILINQPNIYRLAHAMQSWLEDGWLAFYFFFISIYFHHMQLSHISIHFSPIHSVWIGPYRCTTMGESCSCMGNYSNPKFSGGDQPTILWLRDGTEIQI